MSLISVPEAVAEVRAGRSLIVVDDPHRDCLLYTSDAADERSSVALGGRRIIKKTQQTALQRTSTSKQYSQIKD